MQEGGDDVGKTLLSEGLIIVEKRKEKRLQKLVQEYTRAQESARKARVSPDYRCETAIYKITRASVHLYLFQHCCEFRFANARKDRVHGHVTIAK